MTARTRGWSRRRRLVVGVVTVVIVVAAAGWWFLRGDDPDPFDIDTAADALDDTTTSTTEPVTARPDGTWVVDTEFVADDGTRSEAGYRVNEELSTIGKNTVVGRTSQVTGSMTIDGTTITAATFTVDMTSVATDSRQRDTRYRRALDVTTFPQSTFVLTQPIPLGTIPPDGQALSTTAVGDLTVHGVTKSVELTLEAVLSGDRLVVVGSTPVLFADFAVEKPTAAIVVSLDDQGIIEFQVFMTKLAN